MNSERVAGAVVVVEFAVNFVSVRILDHTEMGQFYVMALSSVKLVPGCGIEMSMHHQISGRLPEMLLMVWQDHSFYKGKVAKHNYSAPLRRW